MSCRRAIASLLRTRAIHLRSSTPTARVATPCLSSPTYHLLPTSPTHTQLRFYAKKKGGDDTKAKSKKGKPAPAGEEEPIAGEDFEFDVDKYSDKMKRGVEGLKRELANLRVGRATPGSLADNSGFERVPVNDLSILDSVQVSHQGARVALPSIAQVTVKDPQTLLVIVSDEELTPIVERSIRTADLGLNPMREDSTVLKVPIPRANQEVKDSLLKSLHKFAEKTREHVRNVRADARKELQRAEKSKTAPQDFIRQLDKEIQATTEKFVKEVDTIISTKTKEIESA
ncbi:hypothetical protein HDV00_007465 [Rhizophlyctis rosea]|nr:hypothetical protein HDV00_007465 [Rhizophlyctis rosea]